MKKTTFLLAFAASTLLAFNACDSKKDKKKTEEEQRTNLNYDFKLSVKQTEHTNAPALQSFAHGVYGDYWVLFSGRTNDTLDDGGIHNMNNNSNYSTSSFPPRSFNTAIHLYNFKEDKLSSVSMYEFQEYLNMAIDIENNIEMKEYVEGVSNAVYQLRCTNPLVTQVDEFLYIIGGYGTNIDSTEKSASYQTFNTVTRIHIPTLVNLLTMKEVNDIGDFFRQGSDDRLKSTGGEVHYIDGTFYLCGGHNFGKGARNGQQYVDAVYPFSVSNNPSSLFKLNIDVKAPISDYPDTLGSAFADENSKFRRRDGPMVPILYENNGQHYEGVGFYGGVFKPGNALAAWNDAIYIKALPNDPSNQLSIYHFDTNYDQTNYNVYSCPDFGVVAKNAEGQVELHTFLPGGIGDGSSDGNLSAFSNSYVEAILNTKTMSSNAKINKENLFNSDKFYGAEAAFIKANDPSIKYFSAASGKTEFIDANSTFSSEGGSKVVGYIYGGIEADTASPASGSNTGYGPGLSQATKKIWEVTLHATPN